VASDLWIPTGSALSGALPVGRNAETGGHIVSHELTVKATDKFGKVHKQKVRVLADDNTSQAEIEEMMGHAAENFIRDVRERYDKRPPTEEERKKIGHSLNEYLSYRTRRRESTVNKIYF